MKKNIARTVLVTGLVSILAFSASVARADPRPPNCLIWIDDGYGGYCLFHM
jgi:hypothetical protein